MKITSRFTVAVHTLLAIHILGKERKMTSEEIAASVNVNPVVIRRTLQSLKAAGLVSVRAGSGGTVLTKAPAEISLYDVYSAMDCVEGENLFHFHDHPNPACPVGRRIHALLDGHLVRAQRAMEDELRGVSLADLAERYETID